MSWPTRAGTRSTPEPERAGRRPLPPRGSRSRPARRGGGHPGRLAFSLTISATWTWRVAGSSKVELTTSPRTVRCMSVTSSGRSSMSSTMRKTSGWFAMMGGLVGVRGRAGGHPARGDGGRHVLARRHERQGAPAPLPRGDHRLASARLVHREPAAPPVLLAVRRLGVPAESRPSPSAPTPLAPLTKAATAVRWSRKPGVREWRTVPDVGENCPPHASRLDSGAPLVGVHGQPAAPRGRRARRQWRTSAGHGRCRAPVPRPGARRRQEETPRSGSGEEMLGHGCITFGSCDPI
jgi:hypothetical protein